MLFRRYALVLFVLVAFAATGAFAQTFGEYLNFPNPGAGAFGVVGDALPDGRLVLWNGDTVYVQYDVGTDAFTPIASGYAGDPGFLLVQADGHSLLLGAGYGGNVYEMDVDAPVDYTPSSLLFTLSHQSGSLLSPTLLLLDVGVGFSDSAIEMIDLSAAKSSPVSVLSKSVENAGAKELVIDKPGYSADVFVDQVNGLVYVTDAGSFELRSFTVAALTAAFNTQTPLVWATDGTPVGAAGDFYGGGVSGITQAGLLVIAGADNTYIVGGIQLVDPNLVDPSLAFVVTTLDPAGTQPYYSVIYNSVTDRITPRTGGGVAYGELDSLQAVPAVGTMGQILLVLSIVMLVGVVSVKRQPIRVRR